MFKAFEFVFIGLAYKFNLAVEDKIRYARVLSLLQKKINEKMVGSNLQEIQDPPLMLTGLQYSILFSKTIIENQNTFANEIFETAQTFVAQLVISHL